MLREFSCDGRLLDGRGNPLSSGVQRVMSFRRLAAMQGPRQIVPFMIHRAITATAVGSGMRCKQTGRQPCRPAGGHTINGRVKLRRASEQTPTTTLALDGELAKRGAAPTAMVLGDAKKGLRPSKDGSSFNRTKRPCRECPAGKSYVHRPIAVA